MGQDYFLAAITKFTNNLICGHAAGNFSRHRRRSLLLKRRLAIQKINDHQTIFCIQTLQCIFNAEMDNVKEYSTLKTDQPSLDRIFS